MAVETNNKLVQVADLVNFATKNDGLYPRKAAVTAEIDEKVAAKLGSAYKPKASIASADDLQTPVEADLGSIFSVKEAFTTTEDFVGGEGQSIPAGTTIVVVETEDGDYKYDVMGGMVDLTDYAKSADVASDLDKKIDKTAGMGLSSNDFTNAEKDKLAGIEVASSAEVIAALDAALGLEPAAAE